MIKTRNVAKDDPLRKQVYVIIIDGTVAAGDNKGAIPIGGLSTYGGEVEGIYLHAKTGPVGGSDGIQIQVANGSTDIFATKGTIAVSATTGSSTDVTVANAGVSNGDVLDIDIDSVGTSTAGADITITLVVRAHGSLEG